MRWAGRGEASELSCQLSVANTELCSKHALCTQAARVRLTKQEYYALHPGAQALRLVTSLQGWQPHVPLGGPQNRACGHTRRPNLEGATLADVNACTSGQLCPVGAPGTKAAAAACRLSC